MTVKEVALKLGIGLDRAYEAAAMGHIPTIPMGGRRVVLRAKFEKLLEGEPLEAA